MKQKTEMRQVADMQARHLYKFNKASRQSFCRGFRQGQFADPSSLPKDHPIPGDVQDTKAWEEGFWRGKWQQGR